MAWPPTNTTRTGVLGPDSARFIRPAIAMLLRMGVGLSMLGTGLAGYFHSQRPGANINPWGQSVSLAGLDPFLSLLPYLSIMIGVALLLGFLTTFAAIAAGFYSLVEPILEIVRVVSQGPMNGFNGMPMGNNPYMAIMMMSPLLTYAVLIWLSPLENHPFSVDALIFGRNQVAPSPPVSFQPAASLDEAETTVDVTD